MLSPPESGAFSDLPQSLYHRRFANRQIQPRGRALGGCDPSV